MVWLIIKTVTTHMRALMVKLIGNSFGNIINCVHGSLDKFVGLNLQPIEPLAEIYRSQASVFRRKGRQVILLCLFLFGIDLSQGRS